MSLKKKLSISFFISASIIAVLIIFEYMNFIELKKEIRHLEITDTLRSKSLQLRRHEKNFFLYGPAESREEIDAVYKYLSELNTMVNQHRSLESTILSSLKRQIGGYRTSFERIVHLHSTVGADFRKLTSAHRLSPREQSLLAVTVLEQPLLGVEFLERDLHLTSAQPIIRDLKELDSAIKSLRKSGEEVLNSSKELDRIARQNAEGVIYKSQAALFVLFPLSLFIGIGLLFFITDSIVKKLRVLTDFVEKTGKGTYAHITLPEQARKNDEVGILITTFNTMEDQLAQREKELIQSKKLAEIGTFASGIAHELNNPLSNITTTAQRLLKKIGGQEHAPFAKGLNDILGQSVRVKRIITDLLEFAKGREPQFRSVELHELIRSAYKLVSRTLAPEHIEFFLTSSAEPLFAYADPGQLEQVFINLFTNAIEAMSGEGDIRVTLGATSGTVTIKVADTGKGIPHAAMEKIFEPFFTTKDKGTGLGLAIVFSIIQKQRGTIEVESREGQGTVVTITLPESEGPQ